MHRSLVLFTSAFAVGIVAANVSNSVFFIICLLFFLIVLSCLLRLYLFIKPFILFITLIFFAGGAGGFLAAADAMRESYRAFGSKWVTVEGFIDSAPEVREYYVSYRIRTYSVSDGVRTESIRGGLILSVYRGNEHPFMDYGREVIFSGRLELPKHSRNPGGYDYSLQLAKQRVSATVFSYHNEVKSGAGFGGNRIKKLGLSARAGIVDTINRCLPAEHAGLLNGMLIGSREGLTEKMKEDFSRSGLSHLVAVSGANVAFIMAPLVFLFKKLRIKRRLYSFIIIWFLFMFLFVTGFDPSVVRAVIMADVVLIGRILIREPDLYTAIAASALILMLYNPYSLFDIGFQLSYAATIALVLFQKSAKKFIGKLPLPGFIVELSAATLAAQIGVLPITVYHFNTFSPLVLLSNLAAAPAAGLITVLGSAMALLGQVSIGLSRIVGYVNYLPLSLVLYSAELTSAVPFASIKVFTPPLSMVLLYYGCAVFFLWYVPEKDIRLKPRHFAAPLAVILILLAAPLFRPAYLEVTFLDVGQGDSCFISAPTGVTLLLDGGGGFSSDPGKSVIIPYLLDRRIGRLDIVAATHGHDDHIGGLQTVLREYPCKYLLLPDNGNEGEFDKLLEPARKKDIEVRYCKNGDKIKLDAGTTLEVVHSGYDTDIDGTSLNNGSLVLKLSYGSTDILFCGDIEKEAEELMLSSGAGLEAEIIKVPHHGSPGSSTPAFIERVDPEMAVISVGRNNFGHPSEEVLERYGDRGVRIYRTDRDGAVIITTDGNKIWLERTSGDG